VPGPSGQAHLPPDERWITLPDGVPDFTLGWGAIAWASKYLHQPDGDSAGERWKFTDEQARFILWWYGLDERARWLYSHGMQRRGKGWGKSPNAAALAIIELCGPVRFDRWAKDATGRKFPVGKPVAMPLVQIAATAESQGLINTMRMVRALIADPEDTTARKSRSRVTREYGLDAGKTLIYKPGGGQLHVITSSSAAAEGALTTFAVCDQTEAWCPGNGGVELIRVLNRNTRKSGSRMVQTANAWEPGTGSVAQETHDAWVAEQEGRTRGGARTLMDIRAAPPATVIEDRQSLLAGLAVGYGDSAWVDLENIADDGVYDLKTPLDVSKRFYLNWPTAPLDAWVDPREWARWADPSVVVADGEEIAMGFDGSRTRDATALIGCRITDGYTFELGTWETQELAGGARSVIPVAEVDAAVARAFDRWTVLAFFADVQEWESFTKVSWPQAYASRLEVMSVPGGRDPQPIAWDMRGHVAEFTAACEMVAQEIAGDEQAFSHDGSGVLARHVGNARRRPNRFGVSVGKESKDSAKKIDACVAMIIARHARRLVLAQARTARDKKKSRSGRVSSWS